MHTRTNTTKWTFTRFNLWTTTCSQICLLVLDYAFVRHAPLLLWKQTAQQSALILTYHLWYSWNFLHCCTAYTPSDFFFFFTLRYSNSYLFIYIIYFMNIICCPVLFQLRLSAPVLFLQLILLSVLPLLLFLSFFSVHGPEEIPYVL